MKNWQKIALIALFFILVGAWWGELAAQCPMCKMSAESNLKNGGSAGRGLNTGILYMLVLPYLLVAFIGYWWWKNRKTNADTPSEPFRNIAD